MNKAAPTTQVLVDGQIVEGGLAPQDRTFRNAWSLEGGAIEVNMVKAMDIQRDRIREERAPILAALDIEFMKALGSGGDISAIEAQKQVLRDAPAHASISTASTPDELKAITLTSITT